MTVSSAAQDGQAAGFHEVLDAYMLCLFLPQKFKVSLLQNDPNRELRPNLRSSTGNGASSIPFKEPPSFLRAWQSSGIEIHL